MDLKWVNEVKARIKHSIIFMFLIILYIYKSTVNESSAILMQSQTHLDYITKPYNNKNSEHSKLCWSILILFTFKVIDFATSYLIFIYCNSKTFMISCKNIYVSCARMNILQAMDEIN